MSVCVDELPKLCFFLFAVCVTILLNDDAFGEFSYNSDSVAVTIIEAGEMVTAANGMHT